ncbi:zinc finger protein CG2199-like [Scaptodrosophila lebanonensis]|uniref:Zinc finger protein CG2199-like n=1 Tax=Drosophila lebanonensis TaxID=7225 RepID=A0A6J2UAL0_DROLE|nr:zinc finger protein CG2199-like [Scaptodrosophila lebanonensis]
MYSARKAFGGRKVLDILQTVTHRSIPLSIPVKLCTPCTSSLLCTATLIEKFQKLVNTFSKENPLPEGVDVVTDTAAKPKLKPRNMRSKSMVVERTPILDISLKKQPSKSVTKQPSKSAKQPTKSSAEQPPKSPAEQPLAEVVDVVTDTAAKPKLKPRKMRSKSMVVERTQILNISLKKQPSKSFTKQSSQSAKQPTKSSAEQPPKSPAEQPPKSPSKQKMTKSVADKSKSEDQRVACDESLLDGVKIIPSKENLNITSENQNKKLAVFKLFAPTKAFIMDETESEDEFVEKEDNSIKFKRPSFYKCKLCEFQTKVSMALKKHLMAEHGQKRTRVHECTVCLKGFGQEKALKKHLATHDKSELTKTNVAKPEIVKTPVGTTNSHPEKESAAVKSPTKEKLHENEKTVEYTFAVNGTDSSTPNPSKRTRRGLEFKCDICDSDLKTVKAMKEHMKSAHEISAIKLFVCELCHSKFSTNQQLKKHCTKKHMATAADPPDTSANGEKGYESPDVIEAMNSDVEEMRLASSSKKEPEAKEALFKVPKQKLAKTSFNVAQEEINACVADSIPTTEKARKRKANENSLELDTSLTQIIKRIDQTEASPAKPNENNLSNSWKKVVESPVAPETNLTKPEADEGYPGSPSKKKRKEKKYSESSVVDLFDEVNVHVNPHKKELLSSDVEESDCSICGKTVNSRSRLDSHVQKKHSNILKCPICKKLFKSRVEYVAHFSFSCDSDNGLPCGVQKCKKVFEGSEYLSGHLVKKHDHI